MNKMIYYRPNQSDCELLTEADVKRLHKVWGSNQPYNFIETIIEDQNSGSGLPIVTEMMAVIQCNRHLNERNQALVNRITKGLTPSKSRFAQYVEENLLIDLIQDAKQLFVKEGGDLREVFGIDPGKIVPSSLPFKEFKRIYGIPYVSIMDKVKESEEQIGDISKVIKKHKINYTVDKGGDQQSSYKYYNIKGKLSYDIQFKFGPKSLYEKFPFLGKLHQSGFAEDRIQIYLYDYHLSNNNLHAVVNHLVEKNQLTLK